MCRPVVMVVTTDLLSHRSNVSAVVVQRTRTFLLQTCIHHLPHLTPDSQVISAGYCCETPKLAIRFQYWYISAKYCASMPTVGLPSKAQLCSFPESTYHVGGARRHGSSRSTVSATTRHLVGSPVVPSGEPETQHLAILPTTCCLIS